MNAIALKEITAHYRALDARIPLRPVRNEADYSRAVEALNTLLDAGAGDEAHPLADLAATLGELIGDYEDRHRANETSLDGVDMLRFLMQQHGLRQSDVPEVGSQGVVSEVLAGRRALNLRQIQRLAERFSVPARVFV